MHHTAECYSGQTGEYPETTRESKYFTRGAPEATREAMGDKTQVRRLFETVRKATATKTRQQR